MSQRNTLVFIVVVLAVAVLAAAIIGANKESSRDRYVSIKIAKDSNWDIVRDPDNNQPYYVILKMCPPQEIEGIHLAEMPVEGKTARLVPLRSSDEHCYQVEDAAMSINQTSTGSNSANIVGVNGNVVVNH